MGIRRTSLSMRRKMRQISSRSGARRRADLAKFTHFPNGWKCDEGKDLRCSQFLSEANVDDYILVFFAGHGLLDDSDNYYFGTVDVDFDNPSGRGLPYEKIEEILDGLKSRQKLVLIDTCHAGEVDRMTSQTLIRRQSSLRRFWLPIGQILRAAAWGLYTHPEDEVFSQPGWKRQSPAPLNTSQSFALCRCSS